MGILNNVKYIYKVFKRFSSQINICDTYILDFKRTPIGALGGKLSSLTGPQLGAKALLGLIENEKFNKNDVQEFILGCCIEAGMNQNPARQVLQLSELPSSVINWNLNRLCGSGMKAIVVGSQILQSNVHELIIVGGIESISNVPFYKPRRNPKLGDITLRDGILWDAIFDPNEKKAVDFFAEQTVKEYRLSREVQDEFALASYQKAAKALNDRVFEREMVPVCIKNKSGKEEIINEDEEIKRLNIEKFRKLLPEQGRDGTITRGNTSKMADGAAMMVLASGNYVLKKNLRPLARIVSVAESSVDPAKFNIAPAVAIPLALVRSRLNSDQINLWEINETFAITPILNSRILQIPLEKVNIHGGAISMGHPFGATGIRLVGHLALMLKPGQFGCASTCLASGGGCAVIIEKLRQPRE